MVFVITIAFRSLTKGLMENCVASSDFHFLVYRSSDDQHIHNILSEGSPKHRNMTWIDYRENMGVSRLWNEGIVIALQNKAEHIIIINDDMDISLSDFEAAINHSCKTNGYVTFCSGFNKTLDSYTISHGYSFFVLNKVAIDTVGFFDQNFWPAYYEDNDYDYRCRLSGLKPEFCETKSTHIGSNSLRVDAKLRSTHNNTFRLNGEYYVRKWGGGPNRETYKSPFNRKDIPLKIEWNDAFSPYERYNISRAI